MDAVNEVEVSKTAIYSKFDKLVITRKHRGKGRNRINGNFNAAQFISEVNSNYASLRAIRSKITQLNSAKVKLVYLESINRLNARASVWATHLLRIVKDISLYKCKNIWELSSSPKSNQFIVVKYVNKYVEDIGLSRILKDHASSQLFPAHGHMATPSASFKYLPSIRSKVTNYRQTNDDLLRCHCSSSTFKDQHHHHIVSGNLDIIQNEELRNLLKKGLNYRDQAPPNKQKAFSAVKEAVDNYIKKKSSLISKPTSMFMEWKNDILTKAKQKLDTFSSFHYNSVLSKPYVMEELSCLICFCSY